MQFKMSGTKASHKQTFLVTGILLAALAGCDRKVEQPQSVAVPAKIANLPTTNPADNEYLDVKANLDVVPYLGATLAKTIDGEQWLEYLCGIRMQEERQGSGDTVKTGQYAHVAYKGTFPGSNAVFDQADKDHPFVFRLGSKKIIKGWNLVVATMSIGCKRKFYIPANLAYGAHGSLPTIPPNQPLIFEIEILDITGVQTYLPASPIVFGADPKGVLDPIPPLGDPVLFKTPDGETWQKYPSGMMVQQLAPGTGDHAKFGQMAQVSYVGMLAKDKSIFDKREKGKDLPFDCEIGSKDIIKGWNLALSMMSEGEKLRIYLPPELAYGEKGHSPKIGPNEALIFEIELMRVTGDEIQWPGSTTQPDSALVPSVAGPATVPATQP